MTSPRRNRPPVALPTAAELDILAVLWRLGTATVREVHDELGKDNGYTTTLKQMQLMTEKGLLIRGQRFGSHVYEASVPKEQTQRQIAGDLLKRAFDGSARSLVMGALSAQPASREELDEIRGMLDDLCQRERTFDMNAMQMLSSRAVGGTPRLDAGPLPLAGLGDCGSVRGRTPSGGAHIKPARAIPARLRGPGSHDGRSASDLGADAGIGRKSGCRLSHPKYSPGRFHHAVATTAALPASVRATVSTVQPTQFLLWVVMVWLAGAVVFWVRLAGGWVVAARMRSVLVRRAPPEWQEILRKLGARIGLSRPVRLLVSALVQAPTVVGWLRPVVLVPVGALGGLPAEHLEALLLHELAHIRRHDYLVNILQSVAEALLFYHPAVWWVSGHIRAERELCCDDVAVSVSGDALTYARALAQLESYRPAHLSAAVAANGGSLADRIARLLGQSRPAVRTGLGPGVLAVAILLVAAAYGLFGQSDAHPAFRGGVDQTKHF